MTATNPDAPPPALGELARLATELQQAEAAARAYAPSVSPSWSSSGYNTLVKRERAARKAFEEAATPDVVLQLVALATGGAEAKLREALEMIVDLTADEDDGDPAHTLGQVRERAEAALTPERPADAR